MAENPETGLQKAILELLFMRGHFAWRQNNIPPPIFEGKERAFKGFRKAVTPGVPDIIGVLGRPLRGRPRGTFFAVEVKMPGKDATPDQKRFLERVREKGGIGIVAHSQDEVLAAGL